jgi:hypothetical protein
MILSYKFVFVPKYCVKVDGNSGFHSEVFCSTMIQRNIWGTGKKVTFYFFDTVAKFLIVFIMLWDSVFFGIAPFVESYFIVVEIND